MGAGLTLRVAVRVLINTAVVAVQCVLPILLTIIDNRFCTAMNRSAGAVYTTAYTTVDSSGNVSYFYFLPGYEYSHES